MTDLSPQLRALQEAVQGLINAHNEQPTVMHSAIVVWEEMTFSESGDPLFEVSYSMPSHSVSVASALGLLRAGQIQLEHVIREDLEDD